MVHIDWNSYIFYEPWQFEASWQLDANEQRTKFGNYFAKPWRCGHIVRQFYKGEIQLFQYSPTDLEFSCG